MAGIPVYDPSSQLARGLEIPQGGAEAFGNAASHVARELRVAGEGLANVADTYQRHQAIQETSDLTNGFTSGETQWREQWKQEVATNPSADPDQFFKDHIAPAMDQLGENASTDKGREHFNNLRAQIGLGLLTQWHAERSQLDRDNAVSSANDVTEQAKKNAYDDPASLPSQLQISQTKVDGIFSAAGVPAALKADHFRQQSADIANAAADGLAHMAESGKASALQIDAAKTAINDPDGPFRKNMSATNYASINDRLDKARATVGTINSALEQQQLSDIYRQMKENGGSDTADRGRGIISRMPETTKEEVLAKAKAERDYESAASYGKVAGDLAFAPESALPGIAQGVSSAAKTETDPDKLRQLQAAGSAVYTFIGADGRGGERAKALAKDAPGYVNTHSPVAASTYQAWQQNPTPQTWHAFATVQTALQKQMRPDAPVSLVTPEIADEARNIIRGITTTPEGAAGASRNLFAMSQKYGSDWGTIAHDLKAKGVLSSEQYVAARLYSDPAAQGTAEAVLNASSMKGGDRFNLHGVPEEKARKAAISALSPFEATLGNANDRSEVMSGFTDALTHVIQASGVDPNNATAVQGLAHKLILDEFQTAGSTHTIRVPANVDADAVTAGTEKALDGIASRDIVVPPSHGALNPQNQKDNYLRTVQLTGRWYTNEDGSGAKLYDQDMHNILERKNGRAVPVSMSWADLTKAAPQNNPVTLPAGPRPFEAAQP